jgi:hypothetical protein
MKAYPYPSEEQTPRTAEEVAIQAKEWGYGGRPIVLSQPPNNALIRASWAWWKSSGPIETWVGAYALIRLVPENYGGESVEYIGWLGDEQGAAFAADRAGFSDSHGNNPMSYSPWS